MPAKAKLERCISVTREGGTWTTAIHVTVGERRREVDYNGGQPYAAHPAVSGDLNLGAGFFGMTTYIDTSRDAPPRRPLSLDHCGLRFRDLHSATARDLREMAGTAERIERKLAKMRDQLGHAQGFGEHVIRLAAAIGAKWIALRSNEVGVLTGQTTPDDGTWTWYEVRNARHVLDAIRDHHLPGSREPLVQEARRAAQDGLS